MAERELRGAEKAAVGVVAAGAGAARAAPAGSARQRLRGMDYAAGRHALSPTGGGAAFAGVSVPHVATIKNIRDPVRRNLAINLSYHAFHESMTAYLGAPYVANWCTFGQQASTEVGEQIHNLQDAFGIMRSLPSQSPIATLFRVKELVERPGMAAQSVKLALGKAGIGYAELNRVYSEYQVASTVDRDDLLNPVKQLAEMAILTQSVAKMARQIAGATPAILTSLKRVYGNLVKGNREIYLSIAPAYAEFLRAANGSPGGVVGAMSFEGDDKGFLAAAFAEYSQVRRLANEIATLDPSDPRRKVLGDERKGHANRANLLVGYQEQLVILQPIFDTMGQELAAMSGTMTLGTPAGTIDLARNWGDFYSRMGIDRHGGAPSDPQDITPDHLPPLHNPKNQQFKGTIGEFFTEGLTDRRLEKRHIPSR